MTDIKPKTRPAHTFVTGLSSVGLWSNDPALDFVRVHSSNWEQFLVHYKKDVYTSAFTVTVWADNPASTYTSTTAIVGAGWNILSVDVHAQNLHDDRFSYAKSRGLWIYRSEAEGFEPEGKRYPVVMPPSPV